MDEPREWSKKWKFKFAPAKSAIVIFNRSYKPGADSLLFFNGNRIAVKSSYKFLGVWFDSKLLWENISSTPTKPASNKKKTCSKS